MKLKLRYSILVRQYLFSLVLFISSTALTGKEIRNSYSSRLFQTDFFIENKGQFNQYNTEGDSVFYGIENGSDHFYFGKGSILCRIVNIVPGKRISRKTGLEKEHMYEARKDILIRWIGFNKNLSILAETKSRHYFTFGESIFNSFGYKKLTYKNIYNHIDLVYEIPDSGGIAYKFILRPGADISDIKFEYNGEGLSLNEAGNRITIGGQQAILEESGLMAFYENGEKIDIRYSLNNNIISFKTDIKPKPNTTLTIDPWIKPLNTLYATSTANNKGFDVDFDLAGNLYVYGGNGYVAKYNKNGDIIWVFNGSIPSLSWTTGSYYGNFVVDRSSGKVYVGQGFEGNGSRIIRLDSSGSYDNFVTAQNYVFQEVWEMNYNCQNGNIFGMGGSTSSNLNLGSFPQNGSFTPVNITTLSGNYQDILSSAQNSNGQMFVIIASNMTSAINNHILLLNSTYSGPVWNVATGKNSFKEADNKPYVRNTASNGFNALAANNNYVYYYDGIFIMAFRTSDGSRAGIDSIGSHMLKYQGGIQCDACNNVYVGGNSGNIIVFSFDGKKFTRGSDIQTLGKNIYDLKLDAANNLIYVSGNEFISVQKIPGICSDTVSLPYNLDLNCKDGQAIIKLKIPNNGFDVSYIWTDLTEQKEIRKIDSKYDLSDTATQLKMNHKYSVQVYKSQVCNLASMKIEFYLSDTVTRKINLSICPGDTAFFNNRKYTLPGNYKDTISDSTKCTMFVNIDVRYGQHAVTTQDLNICTGDSVKVANRYLKYSGTYYDTMSNSAGCDSIIVSVVKFLPAFRETTNHRICLGDTLEQNGHFYTSSGEYSDTFFNVYGCDSILIKILVVDKSLLCACDRPIRMPNVFTPNKDGTNEYFPDSLLTGMKLSVYNRWGVQLYHNTDGKGWDGSYNGNLAADGTYYFLMEYTDCHDQAQKHWGVLRLIR